jgi:predicted nucleotidyltransferase
VAVVQADHVGDHSRLLDLSWVRSGGVKRAVAEHLIYSVGTQVVVTKKTYLARGRVAHPAGAVAVIVRSPLDRNHPYRVKFNDGFEVAVQHDHLVRLSEFKRESAGTGQSAMVAPDLRDRIIYRCVIGSRAYGLDDDHSDTDRRGIYLPPADMHWSLYGVPEQLEDDAAQEAYWELQKFIVLALKANPNVLECLYSPLVEHATPLASELLGMRDAFLSKFNFQTYSGYVASQFKKMQADIRNQGRVKWKHVMHLIRLLIAGIDCLQSGTLTIAVAEPRDRLLAIKRGEIPFDEADAWRKRLQVEFEAAFQRTRLPDRPDYARANAFLIAARRLALQEELP